MGLFSFLKPKKPVDQGFEPFVERSKKSGDYAVFQKKLLHKSLILLVVGRRGSGKTALGMKFLELFSRKTRKRCYILGYENIKLPSWITKIGDVKDARNDSVVLIDEGALIFSARESMKDANKAISNIMVVARHKGLTLIFLSQNSAMIDLNILRLVDVLVLKEPSLLQSQFERKALKDIYGEIKASFNALENKNAHFYVYDDDYQGMLSFSLPGFWSDEISKSFKDKGALPMLKKTRPFSR
ncbi:MAG: ATP-binding protein [Nanoarchaeota archaeon]